MSWIDQVKAWPLSVVAAAIGMHEAGSAWAPCPACDAEQRGSSDRRGPVGFTADEGGWRCLRCDASGDALTLARLHVNGGTALSRESWGRVRDWCAERRWCDPCTSGQRQPVRVAPRPALPPRKAPEPPRRPPADEVAWLWNDLCRPVTGDPEVSAYLRGRGLDPAAIEDLDLARALPAPPRAPEWARCGRAVWARSGHRLITPLFGATGELESVRARAVVAGAEKKALAPAGYQVGGLVFACPLARLMLAGADLGDGTPAAELVRGVGLVVVEGDPDYWSWASRYGAGTSLERAPAVVGVESGAWTDAIAARVPDGARVIVRTHLDEGGEKYAQKVAAALAGRCEVFRLIAEPEPEGQAA